MAAHDLGGGWRQLASDAGNADGESASLGEAFAWGILSASSLIFGSGIGIYRLPAKVVRAGLMAFGGGALIEALSIELFAHIIATARGGHGGAGECAEASSGASGASGGSGSHGEEGIDRVLVFIALASALFGGLLFAGLDRALSNHGAFLRKASTVRAYVGRLRYALMRRLIARLQRVPMFEVLTEQQLQRLAYSMVKEKFPAGATIFRELRSDSSIFFILSGCVKLTVTHSSALSGATTPRTTPAASGAMNDTGFVVDKFRLGPNDIFGEMALFTSETLQAHAVALSPACVLRIPSKAIHNLLASNRRLQEFVAMTAIDRLRETEVFARCTPSTVARLVSFMRQAEFEAGDVLFYDVDAVCPIYFVILGRVEVVTVNRASERHAAATGVAVAAGTTAQMRRVVNTNDLLGTEHFQLGRAVHAVATALERTTVLVIQRKDVDTLCAQDERFRQAVLSTGTRGLELHQVSLVPPEGMAAPTKFGNLEQLGWHRSPGSAVDEAASGAVKLPGLGSNMGWQRQQSNPEEGNEDMQKLGGTLCGTGASLQQVTSHSGDDKAVAPDMAIAHDHSPRPSTTSKGMDIDPSVARFTDEDEDESVCGVNDTHLPELLANADATALDEKATSQSHDHDGHGHGHNRGMQAAMMIWLGILIDGVPESVVMGILVNSASKGTLLAFVVGVFLANFPEAMSSAGTMHLHGMRRSVIMLMWGSITILTGCGALLGAAVFPSDSKSDPTIIKLIAGIEGLCGGAMLCMIANTVLPEAFEQGGNVTGLSTLCGFLVAIAVSTAQ